ncbi:MAG: hypothetical protein RR211_08425 [Pseudoflavonifractor sp.]
METIYYHLDARELSVCDQASGQAAPVARRYTCLQKRTGSASIPGGAVLNFADYCPAAAQEEALPPAAPRPATHRVAALLPDLCATLAIVVMAIVVIARFLPLL